MPKKTKQKPPFKLRDRNAHNEPFEFLGYATEQNTPPEVWASLMESDRLYAIEEQEHLKNNPDKKPPL
ncbi:hypothetical protein [Mucilaginibacter psychrotolerans]|uniref:Uncharacterized protein n=1 Tax=Mucilaginibacter psychrotolerans TaxID=1524096 RepID=A0A4Y8S7K9_9SPHI|nr:hypothetical protein [Mucilaginibacter psychrotolerans]TFF34374.1 hypothetical protein E2R66_22125 [Mucilaginibacter psychrotolerans]